jgi:anti-sigma factor RsiW
MKCQQIQDRLLTDLADAELSVTDKLVVDEHLAGCSVCRAFLASVQEVDAQIAAVDGSGMPPERVWENIRYKIEHPSHSFREKARNWLDGLWLNFRPAFASTGMVFAALLGVIVLASPVLVQKERALAKADHEMLLQLAYVGDEGISLSGTDRIGEGTFVEDLL